MVEPRNRYIFLQDCVGDFIIERVALGLPPKVSPRRILKGELMEALPESEQPDDSTRIALVGVDRTNLRLECTVNLVTRLPRKGVKSERPTELNAKSGPQEISKETVRNVDDSFCVPDTGVFVGLDELRSLNLEDLDLNKTPTKLEIGQRVVTFIKNVCTRGTVRYISEEKDSTGHAHTVVGLELDEKRGTGTGKWKKKQPFSCKKGYAAFVGIETVIAEKEFSGDHGEAAIMSCDHGNITSETLQRNSRDLEGQFNYLKGLLREKEEDEVNLIRQLRQSDKQNKKVQRELMRIEEDLTSLQEQLRQKESGEARLQEQFREIEGQKQNLERQLTRMEQQLREKEQQEDNLQFQLREMKQQLSNCRGQLQEKVSEEEKLQEKLRGNENQLLEKERQEECLQSQLREMKQQLIILQRDKERENANLKDKLKVKMRDIDILERDARDQAQNTVDLQRDLSAAKETLSKYESQLKTRDWVLSRDEILLTDKCLGEGGWGRVLEGKYCGCAVAVKKLKESTLTPQAHSLFEREMDIASRCRHPCLLQFIGATTDERCPLFVTELMETSLRALLGRRQLSEIEVIVISLDVSRALNYLHQRKPKPIVHRDVSSANVLLWKQYDQWRGKLADYGTAKFVQQIMTKYAGALSYGAPEAGSSFNQTVKMDVYSFGVLLCEMCIKSQLPDPDMREEQVALVTNKGFKGLIMWCLEEDPDLRPSMEEIIEKLEQLHLIIIKLA